MKKLIFLAFILTASCNSTEKEISNKNDELIFVVDMKVINNKTAAEVADFSAYYTTAIQNNEPATIGWGFYKSEDKVILIERYTNSEAMIKHAQNVSPEGVMRPHFVKFMEHFEIQKIDVYGDASEAMKAFVEPFNLPFVYHSAFASFSRN